MDILSAIIESPIIASTIATIVGGGVIELFRRRHRQKEKAREWYGKTQGMLANLQQAGRKATAYRDGVNPNTLQNQLSPLDVEIMEHANDAPKLIDESAQLELAIIAAYATGLSTLSEKSVEVDSLDFIRRVQQDAIENYDGDYDMEDLEALFSSFDFDEFAEEIEKEVDVNGEEADELISRFSKESLEAGRPMSIKEALNIPIEKAEKTFENDGFLDTVVDDALEGFVKIVIGLGDDIHERMEVRKNRL